MSRRDYLEELGRLREQVNGLFESALVTSGPAIGDPDAGTWSPPSDLLEVADAFLLFVELPGVDREDIALEARDGKLVLSGSRRVADKAAAFRRMERSYGEFRRVFEIGDGIDADAISARFERGVLAIALPKRGAGRDD